MNTPHPRSPELVLMHLDEPDSYALSKGDVIVHEGPMSWTMPITVDSSAGKPLNGRGIQKRYLVRRAEA